MNSSQLRKASFETTNASRDVVAPFCDRIRRVSGISIKPAKYDTLKSRILSRVSELGLESIEDYKNLLRNLPDDHLEWQVFINSITTNKTDFFREPKHFDYLLRSFLPEWLQKGEKTLRVWSAASSSGEEAYTISMILNHHLPQDRDFKILATDIDTTMVRIGENAVYPNAKLPEIPVEYRAAGLHEGRHGAAGWFRIRQPIKDKVVFKRHNLIEMSAPQDSTFDLIFCRNVFIYFNPSSIEFTVEKLFRSAKPGARLFIGHAESLQRVNHSWDLIKPSIFCKSIK